MEVKPFEQIVREHGPAVLRVCRAVLGPDEAEDAWSETFLAALGAYPDLPEGANVQAWLVTIAKRKAVDQHRSAARNPLPVDHVPEPAPRSVPADTDGLWTALKTLSVRQREALAYHHLAGLPYAEVARLLGGSEASCRRSAADGLKKLRTLYEEDRNGIL
ncbi:sigma-70 family RNA polymerase sigma factor [Arthrobacter yangruifuii]|uniref:Sigma-70 family RNA polymerase sigma factor n=1 Tax=Arthrobacter yangruifuii TaxID=2606616 RepID=A0A5N6MRR7_9MICC|nr:sigma-70 family RNA polymerase sigma factor [Arthrobacter yangruifuii]